MVINDIEKFIENKLSLYLLILEKMVDINSYTLNHSGIDLLGEYTSLVFADLGFSAKKIPSSFKQYGNHLVLEKKGTGDSTIAFISHLDTVYTEEEEKNNNFHWKIEGDRAYGPGTVDIKGGTMMIYILFDLLRYFRKDLFDSSSFTVLLDCAEEVGGADFGDVCRNFLPVENTLATLVFEGCEVSGDTHCKVVSRKGMAAYDVNVSGRSAHSGSAHSKGASAIVQMGELIGKLNGITDYNNGVTVNFGRLTGGTVRNRIADKCSVELEMRASDLDFFDKAVQKIESSEGDGTIESPRDNWRCSIDINSIVKTPPWEQNSRTDELFYLWACEANMVNVTLEEESRGGLSDGNLLWKDYAVLDGLGPGGDNSHCSECDPENGKEQEYLKISSITPVSLINLLALCKLIENSLAGSDQ